VIRLCVTSPSLYDYVLLPSSPLCLAHDFTPHLNQHVIFCASFTTDHVVILLITPSLSPSLPLFSLSLSLSLSLPHISPLSPSRPPFHHVWNTTSHASSIHPSMDGRTDGWMLWTPPLAGLSMRPRRRGPKRFTRAMAFSVVRQSCG
jgi:hypothetical protein